MPASKRVYRRLRDADVAFNPHDDNLRRGPGGEVMLKRGPHAEGGLVDFFDGGGKVELGAGWAETGGVLGGGVDGDGEDGGGAEELLGGEDSGVGWGVSMWRLGGESGIYTLSYSHTAGRNFSWMSQMLWPVRWDLERGLVATMVLQLGEGNCGAGGGMAYKIAGLAIGSLGNAIAFARRWRVTY